MAPRKRTKTFTGCWTCRLRKLKCDEGRPSCGQCLVKSLDCEGYSIRLQWLPPETGPILGRVAKVFPSPNGLQQRCHVDAEILEHVLSDHEIDACLADLESTQSTQTPKPCTRGRGPFAVFGIKAGKCHLAAVAADQSLAGDLETAMITSDSLPETDSIPGRDTLEEVDGSSGTSFSHPNQLSMYEKDAVFSHEAMVTQEDIDMEFTFDLSTPNDGVSYHSDYAELDQVDLQSPLSNSALPFFQYQAQGSAIVPISKTPSGPQTLSVQEKYLMRHYMDRVVHLFTVIRNQKSPWKTQHLPRALQAAGELDIAGSTSKIRVALLRTLLSISAFVLSNDHKVHGRNEKAESWREVASTLRSQAIRLLKLAIETDLHSPTAWRYKEFLATMLSMVTIDVMSGDTATCRVHLAGCRQLIQLTAKRKNRSSPKARALHRIYFFLQTIYQSTRVWAQSRVVEDVSEGEHKIKSQDFTSFEDERQWLDTGDTLPSDLTATEFIYGVPISLFILLRRTTELIESLPPCRPYSAGFQRNFEENVSNQRADELEREILDWSCEEELAQFASGADTETYRIIKEFTVGFHKALIIYFSQHIRLLSFRYLRPYVEIVLDCMEAIENIKTSGEILAGPVSWPMFIAASEAFDESLQQRCKAWFTLTQVYGVGAVRIGNEIIEEVWRKRSQSSQLYSTSLWRVVVEEKQKTLMLT